MPPNVSSVVLEPSVVDATGRPVNGLTRRGLRGARGRRAADARSGRPGRRCRPPTRCSSTRARAWRGAWTSCATRRASCPTHLRPDDRVIVAPFTKTLGTVTGPTSDRDTIVGAIERIEAQRRHGDSRMRWSPRRRTAAAPSTAATSWCSSPTATTRTATWRSSARSSRQGDARSTVYVIAHRRHRRHVAEGRERCCKRLATETGGRAFFPAREFQLTTCTA